MNESLSNLPRPSGIANLPRESPFSAGSCEVMNDCGFKTSIAWDAWCKVVSEAIMQELCRVTLLLSA